MSRTKGIFFSFRSKTDTCISIGHILSTLNKNNYNENEIEVISKIFEVIPILDQIQLKARSRV